jgi:DNA-binding response OmpR family regulator
MLAWCGYGGPAVVSVARVLRRRLRVFGGRPWAARRWFSCRAREFDYDAMILDVLLPGLNGVRVCAQPRSDGRDLPVLMLTARDGAADHVTGLDSGADD